MNKKSITISSEQMREIFGDKDTFLHRIEEKFKVTILGRGQPLSVEGAAKGVHAVASMITQLCEMFDEGIIFKKGDLRFVFRLFENNPDVNIREIFSKENIIYTEKSPISPKGIAQREYVYSIEKYDLVFGIGPAGTGKTYLAMAMAVSAMIQKKVSRIILARPAVEAGEKLGFLPGDMYEKVNPYLRPLYDAMYDMMKIDKVTRMLDKGLIEIAPLGFMRGRTLNDSFIILDEAQNTTSEQMKMFLTRMGNNSKAVVTGDITQVDLPNAKGSGLVEAIDILSDIKEIGFTFFSEKDVVRHDLVQSVIRAYEKKQTAYCSL